MADINNVKTPKPTVDTPDVFNMHFIKFLTKSGWSDEDIREEFIALINSIVLSTKYNPALQKRMISFLQTATKTLNIELNKLELQNNDSIVTVDKDQITNGNKVVSETKNRVKEGFAPNAVANDSTSMLNDLKNYLSQFKTDMSSMGADENQITKFVALAFKGTDDKKDKQYLLDNIKRKLEACQKSYMENNKHSITEKDDTETDKKDEKVPEEQGIKLAKPTVEKPKDVPNEKVSSKPIEKQQPKQVEPPKKVEPPKEQSATEKGDDEVNSLTNDEKDVKINTSRTFLKNYLINDLGWSVDGVDGIIESLFGILAKGKGNLDNQITLNKKLTQIEKLLKKSYSNEIIKLAKSKNFSISMNNIKTLARLYYEWNTKEYNTFKNKMLNIFSIGKSASTQTTINKLLTKI